MRGRAVKLAPLLLAAILAVASASSSAYDPRQVGWTQLARGCATITGAVRPHDLAVILSNGCHKHSHEGQRLAASSVQWWQQVQALAAEHGASSADALAVCGALALGGSSDDAELASAGLHVGRLDDPRPRPHSLQFAALWSRLNMHQVGATGLGGAFVALANAYQRYVGAESDPPTLLDGTLLRGSHEQQQLRHQQQLRQQQPARQLRQADSSLGDILAVLDESPATGGGSVRPAAVVGPAAKPATQAPKPASPRPGSPRPGSPKPGSPRPGSPKPGSPKPGSPKPGSPKPGSPKPGGGKTQGVKPASGPSPPPKRPPPPPPVRRPPPPRPPPPPSPPPPPPPVNPVQPRLEINTLDKRPESDRYRVLFILSYLALFQRDPNDVESFYQLSGIHGVPWVSYNNTLGAQQARGYCWHQSVLFPTWHRPMVHHFEKSLRKAAMGVAQAFVNPTERDAYVEVAKIMRVPYFDWANPYLGAGDFPYMLTTATINVDDPSTPETTLVAITNPFYGFTLPRTVTNGRPWPSTIGAGQETVRRPSNDGVQQTDQMGWVRSMQNNQASFASQAYNLLGAGDWSCLYNQVCSMGVTDLESLHNAVHGAFGGNMGVVPTSGFDPVFWMHHAQIDRLFWLWQQRFPDLWVTPRYEIDGSFYTQGGQTFDSTTGLAPFYISGSSFFTSDDVRDISALGYAYDDGNVVNPGPMSPFGFGRRLAAAPRNGSGVESAKQAAGPAAEGSAWAKALRSYGGGYYGYRWQMNFMQTDQTQLGAPFWIHVYLRTSFKPAAHPSSRGAYTSSAAAKLPGHCGSHYSFSGVNPSMANRKRVDMTVDITKCLLAAGLNPDEPSKVAGRPEQGPVRTPVHIADLVFVAAGANGTDITPRFKFGAPRLSWSLMAGGKLSIGNAP